MFLLDSSQHFFDRRKLFKLSCSDVFDRILGFPDGLSCSNYAAVVFLEDFAQNSTRLEEVTEEGTSQQHFSILPFQDLSLHFLPVYSFYTGIFSNSNQVSEVSTISAYDSFQSSHFMQHKSSPTRSKWTTFSFCGHIRRLQARFQFHSDIL